ncbi:MAG: NnrS family protein [Deltaproteobacteria bacterium]|nr:NnrS family protein [Deltaproteobacteria bacterium]
MSLVKISKPHSQGRAVSCKFSSMLPVITIDKFFLIGALAGFFGSITLGAYVWLIRSGLLPVSTRYHSMRELHAVMQFYLFLTPFILGFLIQSAQKLFETQITLPRAAQLALPATILAAIAILLAPGSILVSAILAASIWGVAACLALLFLHATWPVRLRFGGFAIFGLFSLGAGAFFDLGIPGHALKLFWLGVVPIILATAQQFIKGLLGGRQPAPLASIVTIGLFLGTALALLLPEESQSASPVATILALLTFIVFLFSTCRPATFQHLRSPIGVAFACAHIWALLGAVILSQGSAYADSVLHIWGIGYAVTLILGVSMRIIPWIIETQPISSSIQIVLLLTWQVVPIVRGLQPFYPFPRIAVWIASICALAALAVWAAAIVSSVVAVVSRQFKAKREARFKHQRI